MTKKKTEVTAFTDDDEWMMRAALGLARRALGQSGPNPAVGCILTQQNASGGLSVVARGWTVKGGRPHAETQALEQAGGAARGATAYVTLEPCAHTGQTPPCADALISAGVARVVIAVEDPDPRVSGASIARLAAAGIGVEVGLCQDEARDLNAGFFSRIENGRPLVTLKLATTLDGKIATETGESKWITGVEARRHGHLLRTRHDAVVTGIGTVEADNPSLTCRLDGMAEFSPTRIIVDSGLRCQLAADLVTTAAETPTWIAAGLGAPDARARRLEEKGVKILRIPEAEGGVDIVELLKALGRAGITRLLVEAGARLTASFLKAGCADRLAWYRSARVFGARGLDMAENLDIAKITEAPTFRLLETAQVGADIVQTYIREH